MEEGLENITRKGTEQDLYKVKEEEEEKEKKN